ncbi:hypothetical protein [Xanthomonas campestris]|nr:hypothetical protein [Xanthomonas campestris]WHO87446.1 hypothetical protein QMY63_15180 [Xanthomonas campestris]
MVRAILSGAKTQTRRAVKPQPSIDTSGNFCWNGWNFGQDMAGRPLSETLALQRPCSRTGRVHCPFGKIGDRLWVRETTEVDRATSDSAELARYSSDREPVCYPIGTGNGYDGAWQLWWYSRDTCPSIHMPRKACRLLLEITDVRVELLQAITDADALAEGVDRTNTSIPGYAKERFHQLWTSTGGDWDANPWVWVIGFKQVAP